MKQNKILYWSLISVFSLLYLAVAFVSTLHAITFFQLANTLSLAILLGAAYEIGQASVLFAILMSDNKNRLLAWGMMFLLTALQVTANVYASFKFMDASQSMDWQYWQRAILFGVQADSPETYKVIISWISGALLPLVALGMTALVADNIRLARGEKLGAVEDEEPLIQEKVEDKIKEKVEEKVEEKVADEVAKVKEEFDRLSEANKNAISFPTESNVIKEPIIVDLQPEPNEIPYFPLENPLSDEHEYLENANKIIESLNKEEIKDSAERIIKTPPKKKVTEEIIKPVNKIRGWHFSSEFVDDKHNVFKKGKFIGNDPTKTPTSKKA